MSAGAAGPRALVGRERELAAADAAIADVAGGERRVLAILGETGIGKSALLDALHDRAADAGLLVLGGRAAEHERDVPFGLVVDALDDHVATLHPRRIESVGA
ncbi:MAG TPA: BREX system ATP-binding domain-containing protein, partial [Solirubrobacteraceae bacterium]|nr:BREX system ATP-binding domain-containing protein [Solirubrobacteraceae bacterium]